MKWTSDGGYDYEDMCQMCNGSGVIDGPCDSCGGSGKFPEKRSVDIGTKTLDCEMLTTMSKLPNVKIAPEAVEKLSPVPFKFDGGIGIICPLRKFGAE